MTKIRSFWAVLLGIFMVAGATVAMPEAEATRALGTYVGHTDTKLMVLPPWGDGIYQKSHPAPLVVYPEGQQSAAEVAYCFNMNRTIPNERDTFSGPYDPNNLQTGHGLRYAKNYGESLLPFADNPRKDANQGVLNAMLNGYPKNAAGLQAALKLTDNEMRYATQLAVWYWADSDYGRHITDATENSQEIKKAFKILTGQETSPVQLKKVDPATATLEIYSVSQPTGPSFNYQNLLSAKFVNPLDGNPIKEGDRPVPDLKTTATDQKDGDKVIAAEGGKVKDVVTYSGLTVGTEYVVSGELMEKGSDDKAVGTGIKASKKFTAQAASGTVDVVFDVPSGYAGKKLVAFETLTMSADGKFVAEHKDISDEDQTVTVAEGDRPGPDLKTTATDQKDGDKVIAAEGGKVKDVVTYSGLTVGTEYVVSGELMEKGSDDKAVGTGIKASKKFTAQAASGTVDVVFDVPSGYAGKKLVAFETLTMSADGKFVAEHRDINDKAQTVVVEDKTDVTPEMPGSPMVPEVPEKEPDITVPPHSSEDAWWKILVPAAVIGVGVALLPIIAGSSSISAHSPESQTPTAAKSEVPKETSNKAVPEKKMLAATGASVIGLVLAASLLMLLGLVLVLKRRKES